MDLLTKPDPAITGIFATPCVCPNFFGIVAIFHYFPFSEHHVFKWSAGNVSRIEYSQAVSQRIEHGTKKTV